jgi:predicted DNA-binding transcriptional regulator AlpA
VVWDHPTVNDQLNGFSGKISSWLLPGGVLRSQRPGGQNAVKLPVPGVFQLDFQLPRYPGQVRPPEIRDWYSAREVSDLLGISLSTVYLRAEKGALPCDQERRRRTFARRFPKTKIDALIPTGDSTSQAGASSLEDAGRLTRVDPPPAGDNPWVLLRHERRRVEELHRHIQALTEELGQARLAIALADQRNTTLTESLAAARAHGQDLLSIARRSLADEGFTMDRLGK